MLFAVVLAGCSTVPERAANGKLCTGTKRPYQVKGEWYTPQNHYTYEEVGIASWYGPRFHGQPKSCGEIFNMHGLSAAHKTLPIPSVVEVTNINTGTSVKLLVDDRGPFVENRIIDLSKGAATYLGICRSGIGTVHVKCLPEESEAFAQFVSQYGRYGRDPAGRSWEAIFHQEFGHGKNIKRTQPLLRQAVHQKPSQPSAKKKSPFKRDLIFPRSPQAVKKNKRTKKTFDELLEMKAY